MILTEKYEIQNNKIDCRIEIITNVYGYGKMAIRSFSYHTETSRYTESEARQKAELWIKAATAD